MGKLYVLKSYIVQKELGLPVLPAALPVLQSLPLGNLQLRLLLGGSNLQIIVVMVMVKLEVAKVGGGEGEHTRWNLVRFPDPCQSGNQTRWHWTQSPTWSSLTMASPTPFHKRLLSHSV